MAMAMGMMGSIGPCSPPASSIGKGGALRGGRKGRAVICSAAAGRLTDQYRTLRIQPGASETEVKKAFRQLALQYHPDVCKGGNCGVQFHHINEAYDVVMRSLRGAEEEEGWGQAAAEWGSDGDADEEMRGMEDMWEEWMGWEGAGIRDYSSHINPYL